MRPTPQALVFDIYIHPETLKTRTSPINACWLSDSLGDTEQSYDYVFTLFSAIQAIVKPISPGQKAGPLISDFLCNLIEFINH